MSIREKLFNDNLDKALSHQGLLTDLELRSVNKYKRLLDKNCLIITQDIFNYLHRIVENLR